MRHPSIDEAQVWELYRQKLTDQQMADLLKVSKEVISRWRWNRKLPMHKKPGELSPSFKLESICTEKIAKGCMYWDTVSHCCGYLLKTGKRRPCPAGKGCTAREIRKGGRPSGKK